MAAEAWESSVIDIDSHLEECVQVFSKGAPATDDGLTHPQRLANLNSNHDLIIIYIIYILTMISVEHFHMSSSATVKGKDSKVCSMTHSSLLMRTQL